MTEAPKRLVLVQFGGDFRKADRVLRETGQETYYNHRYILQTLADVQQLDAAVTIICCRTDEAYRDVLASGVTAVGLATDPYVTPDVVLAEIRRANPTHIVFLGPMDDVVAGCLTSTAQLACLWADSFPTKGLRTLRWRRRLRRQLNDPHVEWVANHGRNACRSLLRLGVHESKIIAWDYLHDEDPEEFAARELPGTITLFFAGIIVDSKGIWDVLDALAELRAAGIDAHLRIAGSGAIDELDRRIAERGLESAVVQLGLLPNIEVQREMRAASAVVIPSRPTYAEGQPLTINEALRARTPIVASDHPMFDGILVDGVSAVVFEAGDAVALAGAVRRLHSQPDLYRLLSARAPQTWRQMSVDVKWGDLVRRWVRGGSEDSRWFETHVGVLEP